MSQKAPSVRSKRRWTDEEHRQFLEGYSLHGNQWSKVKEYVPSKTVQQVTSHGRYHAQKQQNSSTSSTTKKKDATVVENLEALSLSRPSKLQSQAEKPSTDQKESKESKREKPSVKKEKPSVEKDKREKAEEKAEEMEEARGIRPRGVLMAMMGYTPSKDGTVPQWVIDDDEDEEFEEYDPDEESSEEEDEIDLSEYEEEVDEDDSAESPIDSDDFDDFDEDAIDSEEEQELREMEAGTKHEKVIDLTKEVTLANKSSPNATANTAKKTKKTKKGCTAAISAAANKDTSSTLSPLLLSQSPPPNRAFIESVLPKEWHEDLLNFLCNMDGVSQFLSRERTQWMIPSQSDTFRAMRNLPPNKVKVVIFGQDPYPRESSATGIAFHDGMVTDVSNSLAWSNPLSPSLRNIIKAVLVAQDHCQRDANVSMVRKTLQKLRFPAPPDWFESTQHQGVLWLNTSLTFSSKERASLRAHASFWAPFISLVIDTIVKARAREARSGDTRDSPAFVLWGDYAKKLEPKVVQSCKDHNVTPRLVLHYHPAVEMFLCPPNPFQQLQDVVWVTEQ